VLLCLAGCGRQELATPPPLSSPETAGQPPVLDDGADALPQAPAEEKEVEADVPPESLTPDVYALFRLGMTFAETESATSVVPVAAGGNEIDTRIYRWEDDQGNYFTARFDNGILVARSRLRQLQTSAPEPSTARVVEDIDGAPAAQIAPGVFIPLDRAVGASNGQPRGVTAPVGVAPAGEHTASTPSPPQNTGPKVAVAGAARRAREGDGAVDETEGRSYQPRARLPEFTRSLRKGRYEVRFVNSTRNGMTAGLRQEKHGVDIAVAKAGKASVFVDRGVYELYFLIHGEQDTLFEARPIIIDGQRATDVEVHLSRDDVEVRHIDHALPE
jgi:hypothetical protein